MIIWQKKNCARSKFCDNIDGTINEIIKFETLRACLSHPKNAIVQLAMTTYDIYDFDRKTTPWMLINWIEMARVENYDDNIYDVQCARK